VQLPEKHIEVKSTKKRLEIITDVVKYLDIISYSDSIISVSKMSASEKVKFYQNHIAKLKISDSIAAKKAADNLALSKQNQKADMFSGDNFNDNPINKDKGFPGGISTAKNPVLEQSLTKQPASSSGMQSNFYFYNAVTVAQGKINFKKKYFMA
jgi:hypothetical protein